MEKIIEIAASISKPLGLAGLIAAFLFFVFKMIISKNIFPQLSQIHSFQIIKTIVDYMFILALTSMVIGAIAYLVSKPEQQNGSNVNLAFDTIFNKADSLISIDKISEARGELDEIGKKIPKDNLLLVGRLETGYGTVERISRNYSRARAHLDAALKILPQTATSLVAKAHLELGKTLQQQDEMPSALKELNEALRLYRLDTNRQGEGDTALELAQYYYQESNYPKSLEMLTLSESVYQTIHSNIGIANTIRTKGQVELARDRPQQALILFQEAKNAYQAVSSKIGEAQALWGIGEAYAGIAEWGEAIRYHKEALQLAQSIPFPMGVRDAYLALANIEIKRGRAQEAIATLRQSIDYFQSSHDELGQMQARLVLGSALIKMGDDDSSASHEIERAYEIAILLKDLAIQSEALWHKAIIQMKSQNFNEAENLFLDALKRAQDEGSIKLQARALQGLGDVQAYTGRTSDAMATLRNARSKFKQSSMSKEASIAGLSLASLLLSQNDRTGCDLLKEIISEFEAQESIDEVLIARKLSTNAQCK